MQHPTLVPRLVGPDPTSGDSGVPESCYQTRSHSRKSAARTSQLWKVGVALDPIPYIRRIGSRVRIRPCCECICSGNVSTASDFFPLYGRAVFAVFWLRGLSWVCPQIPCGIQGPRGVGTPGCLGRCRIDKTPQMSDRLSRLLGYQTIGGPWARLQHLHPSGQRALASELGVVLANLLPQTIQQGLIFRPLTLTLDRFQGSVGVKILQG